jgi:hypothetical protein
MKQLIRGFFGIIVLLSVGWLCLGFYATSQAYSETVADIQATPQSESLQSAGQAGAAIGTGLGLTFFLCTGIPIFLFSLIVYWQMGRSIRRDKDAADTERRHQEELEILRGKSKNS